MSEPPQTGRRSPASRVAAVEPAPEKNSGEAAAKHRETIDSADMRSTVGGGRIANALLTNAA